jgi:hypothetical protein
MKHIVIILTILLAGCASQTEFGPCVGIGDKQDPALVYKISIRNAIIGVIFFQLIAPPFFVLVDEFYCPVGKATP